MRMEVSEISNLGYEMKQQSLVNTGDISPEIAWVITDYTKEMNCEMMSF